MGTLHQTVDLPLFTLVRAGALSGVVQALAESHLIFERALVLTGRGATAEIGRTLAGSLETEGMVVRVEETLGPTFAEVDRVKREMIESFYPQVLVVVGGGSVIDVGKLSAAERRLPWISVPTAASNDGFCSPVVVLRSDGERRSVGGAMPLGVVADLDLLRGSSPRLRRAGMGDLLSNDTACRDWRRAARVGKAVVNGMAHTFALGGVRQMLDAPRADIDCPDFLERVVEGLILSGVAMEVCGTSRPCSGSEHLISHQLDSMGVANALHGEQVGIATPFCAHLQGEDPGPLRAFAASAGLPTRPEDLGIDRDTFLEAARRAPDARPGRWTTLTDVVREPARLADAYDDAYPT